MNWPLGAASGALVAASLLAVRGAVGLDRMRRAAARLVPEVHPPASGRGARRLPAPGWVGPRLRAMGFALSPDAAWWGWAGASVVAGLGALKIGGPGLAALALVTAVLLPGGAWLVWRTRGDGKLEAALPDTLEAVARSLRSGASLRLAIGEAAARGGALADDLVRVAAEVDLGADVGTTLERWGGARPLPGIRLAVAALCLGAEAGGPQARAVDGVAATLRQRLSVAAEARALGAQARVSALVIALSPVVFCAVASSADRGTARFLLHTGTGQLLLATGIALDLVGALWMTVLTKIDQ